MDLLTALNPLTVLRRAGRRASGCCLTLVLLLLLACGILFGLSFVLARRAGAQSAGPEPVRVLLLIDNSNSMWEKEGIGSDPDLLRMRAARLFVSYLGVDAVGAGHWLGVIFFGGQPDPIAPIMPLADDNSRAAVLQRLDDPPRMGWTNPHLALASAADMLQTDAGSPGRQAVVLFTDGKPETSDSPTPGEQERLVQELEADAQRLAAANVTLFVVLLQNSATDADPQIQKVFVPAWQAAAAATPGGRLYQVRQAGDLLDIYHHIAVSLTGRQAQGVVVRTQVESSLTAPLQVEPGLAQLVLAVVKDRPDQEIVILIPDGTALAAGQPGVSHSGRFDAGLEQVWLVDDPQPGPWQLLLTGPGSVTIWKDVCPAPTPSPTPSISPAPTTAPPPTWTTLPPPPPSITPRPTSTFVPTPSPTRIRDVSPLPPAAPPVSDPGTPPAGRGLTAALAAGGFWPRLGRSCCGSPASGPPPIWTARCAAWTAGTRLSPTASTSTACAAVLSRSGRTRLRISTSPRNLIPISAASIWLPEMREAGAPALWPVPTLKNRWMRRG